MLFSDLRKLDNGANFHNVDLHIHSYGASFDVKDQTMTPEAIVDSAVKQKLAVIAITDHNSIKNVERALAHALQDYAGQILVLPGVEVTTAHGHLLVYFAPEAIEQLAKFLSRLDLIGESGHDNTRTAKSMADTIAEAEKLGGICIAAHIDREKTGFDKFAPGFQNWKKDIIISPGLYGLECDSVDSLVWYSANDEAGSAGAERKKMLADRRLAIPARSHLAHLQGSDSHSMTSFEQKNTNKPWTRMKLAELTFNAVRVALTDASGRVRACASVPVAFPRIRGVSITGGFLHQEAIHFSDNLNCFIGGRGTGKSTAIRAVAYAFGLNNEFGEGDNCPDLVTVFCEDSNGMLYRYVRTRSGEIEVRAKEDNSLVKVPVDTFRIEYYGQGELAKVAEDPLKNPQLFQAFLDRHTNLRDLAEAETSLVNNLRENAGRLYPLEVAFNQLPGKKQSLAEVEKKLKLAEEGNLRDVVGTQSKLAAEKAVREAVEEIATEYRNGFNFASIQRSYEKIIATAGDCTDDPDSKAALAAIRTALESNTASVKQREAELNTTLRACAAELTRRADELKVSHLRMSGVVATRLADLKSRGITTDIPGLELLLRQKTSYAKDIAGIEQRSDERNQCREQRQKLRDDLKDVRRKMTERRKALLKGINANLAVTIGDYTVFVRYDDTGITAEFEAFMQKKMHGTYLQDNVIESVCGLITPSELADLIFNREHGKIAASAKITPQWAQTIVDKLCNWDTLYELQVLAKQPKPIITVRTKTTPWREIPVLQLSDGQRHTILLTIAMLAESNIPLVIDQPEDDLDNAFIFSSIVTTLRSIKERRQVILVTHNANIAVLGDSELLLPMCRENDCGKAKDRGSIDCAATLKRVQDILEGGETAFRRRMEIYGH
jgi:DNA repair ATPase RecN/histidinol phosphatase-like PHP family hydrolase